jgi:hypothetical protein
MMSHKLKYSTSEPHLQVFHDRSILVYETGESQIFVEGKLSKAAQTRLRKVRETLEAGFLPKLIDECRKPDAALGDLATDHLELLERLVDSITSEVGRAVVGLTVVQLCIKCVVPEQSIRLHKGGHSYSNTRFSWQDGMPMRSLDKSFITPILRSYGILRTNADGVMMTRLLAENYPYSKLYKAAIRGARTEWLEIVDLLEEGRLDPNLALRHLIALLFNKSERFQSLAEETLKVIKTIINKRPPIEIVVNFIRQFIDTSDYSARLLEIAMHSLFQVLEDNMLLDGNLKPLSQMRSANKKHGNIGDIEVTIGAGTLEILEVWDAKYGKPYLRDELEELNEKLNDHLETKLVGFVVDQSPQLKHEILERVQEIEEIHDVEIKILSFADWINIQLAQSDDKHTLALEWLLALSETLCQKRRDRAPIDEPADAWVAELWMQAQNWGKVI